MQIMTQTQSLLTQPTQTLLHVGCGPKRKNATTAGFNNDGWKEIRLDIDSSVSPDVTGTMTDMGSVDTGSVDADFSSHNIVTLSQYYVPFGNRTTGMMKAPIGPGACREEEPSSLKIRLPLH